MICLTSGPTVPGNAHGDMARYLIEFHLPSVTRAEFARLARVIRSAQRRIERDSNEPRVDAIGLVSNGQRSCLHSAVEATNYQRSLKPLLGRGWSTATRQRLTRIADEPTNRSRLHSAQG